jgi:tyrosyl-tRNA synthetase
VHGPAGLAIAQRASEVLFGGSFEGLKAVDLIKIFANVPSFEMPAEKLRDITVMDAAATSGLCKSKSEVRRLMAEGGLYVNNVRVSDIGAKVSGDMLVDGCVMVLRAGKKNYCLVKIP